MIADIEEEIEKVPEMTPRAIAGSYPPPARNCTFPGKALYMPLRAALTGKTRGPELEKVFVLLGKEKVSRRRARIRREPLERGRKS